MEEISATDSGIDLKRPKLEKTALESNSTCAHWVQRKKRFCKMTVAKGRHYCGEHEPAKAQPGQEPNDGDRIPCPLDGTHTVYKKNVRKHIKICNAREKDDVPAFVQKGINAGDEDPSIPDYSTLKLSELEDEEFFGIIDKVKELYGKYVDGQIETLKVQHKSLDNELIKDVNAKEAKRHLLQNAALLEILESQHQLQDSTSFVEFGAGKGQLAFHLALLLQEYDNSQVILLDRMSLRHKKDNKIENKSLVHRIRVDIADFRMIALDLLNKTKHTVALSKHLCGAATDLTLRCITQSSMDRSSAPPTDFILIALCCHHRCDWNSFVGKEFFQSHGITPRQFVIITKMVSWAICGTGMSRERRRAIEKQSTKLEDLSLNSPQRLPLAERERAGLMCKRILDFARLEYLRQHQYEASLKYYVERNVTLENVCLLAKKKS